MKKRILSLVLAISMLCAFAPVIRAAEIVESGTCGDNLTWTLDDAGTLTISGTGDMDDCDWNSTSNVPWYSQYDSIRNVVICKGVTSIGMNAFYHHYDNLTNVTIPDSVTTIGNGAFRQCQSLTNVIIPNSVTSIGNSAFIECDALTSVTIGSGVTDIDHSTFNCCRSLTNINVSPTNQYYCSIDGNLFNKEKTELIQYAIGKTDDSYIIPDSVTSVGWFAFENCTALTNITIPDSVTSIEGGAFFYCSGLTSVTIPDSVTYIEPYVFYYCSSLTSIAIPKSVTKIDQFAFSHCDSLTDVYYSGSESQWNEIVIGYDNDDLTNATIHYNSTGGGTPSSPTADYAAPKSYSGSVSFATGKGSAEFTYHDNYFSGSSYVYNHDLARISLRFALSAFAKRGSGENRYTTQYSNAEKLLKALDFKNISVNDDYKKKPEANSIGVIAANKKVAFDDGDYTIVAVGIRGGNYEAEWGGNFNVGNGDFHAGFETARNSVRKFVKSYINNNNITGKVKIWITGYSRAGAAANLTAGYFDADPSYFGSVSLDTDDIYAYCFEPPAGVRASTGIYDNVYTNIFNIVNENDPVPKVVMDSWGYARYGVDKYLPLINVPSKKKYDALKNEMLAYYKKYKGGDYLIDDFHKFVYTDLGIWGEKKTNEGIFFDDLLDELGDWIGSPSKYKSDYQEALMYLGEEIMGKGNTDDFLNALKKNIKKKANFLLNKSVSENSAQSALKSVVRATFEDLGCEVSDKTVASIALLFTKICVKGDLNTLIENMDSLFQGHYPELCLAWMDAIEESDLNSAPMRRVCINCPVDVEVYDADGELVAAIYGNEADENSLLPANVTQSGEKRVYLPANGEYEIKVTATDSGNVAYSVKEAQTDGSVKVVSYSDIEVNAGDTLTGTAENALETETTYALEMDGSAVAPKVETSDAAIVSVSVMASGNGSVTGGKSVYAGESVKLTAQPYEGEEFIGWYSGGEFVSKETSYDIIAEENAEFTAEFTENTCEITVSDGADIISLYRINKGESVALEESPKRARGLFKGYYADADFTEEFNADTTFYEDCVFYAEFEDAVNSGDWYYFVKEDGTAAIAGCDSADEVVRIPGEIDGYSVTSLWYGAFIAEGGISSVVLPESIELIDENAFADCGDIANVCIAGSYEEWEAVRIESGNESLSHANIITDFNSDTDADIDFVYADKDSGEVTVYFNHLLRNSDVFCGAFDGAGVLKVVKSADTAAGSYHVDFDLSETGGDYEKLRVFVWQAGTMKPLIDVVEQ